MNNGTGKPWWFPQLTDEAWCEKMREDYPYKAHLSDEEIRSHFAQGLKYATMWGHVRDAYSEYEELANAYLELLKAK